MFLSHSTYQVIVQVMANGNERPVVNFVKLQDKENALKTGSNYYLAAERTPAGFPLSMTFKAGDALVDELNIQLETPNMYYIHFRAVSQETIQFKVKYTAFSFHVRLEFLKRNLAALQDVLNPVLHLCVCCRGAKHSILPLSRQLR